MLDDIYSRSDPGNCYLNMNFEIEKSLQGDFQIQWVFVEDFPPSKAMLSFKLFLRGKLNTSALENLGPKIFFDNIGINHQ